MSWSSPEISSHLFAPYSEYAVRNQLMFNPLEICPASSPGPCKAIFFRKKTDPCEGLWTLTIVKELPARTSDVGALVPGICHTDKFRGVLEP
jgi:hypothetical protein